jgi:hypothetical protein
VYGGIDMDKKTLKALKGSIKKWEKIIDGKGVDTGSGNCPLCHLFYYERGCRGCPVSEKTGETDCLSSPYEKWNWHVNIKHSDRNSIKVYCKTCKNLAEKELKFLKSLLPKED